MASPSSSPHPSLSPSPDVSRPASPDHLAPSAAFQAPNYQATGTNERSPMSVSPGGRTVNSYHSGFGLESPSMPFPSYTDLPPAAPRPPSIRLPNPASPLERLQVQDGHDVFAHVGPPFRTLLRKWWPDFDSPSSADWLYPLSDPGRLEIQKYLGTTPEPNCSSQCSTAYYHRPSD